MSMKRLINKFLLIETRAKEQYWGHFVEFDDATRKFRMSDVTRGGAALPTDKWFDSEQCRVIQVCAPPRKRV